MTEQSTDTQSTQNSPQVEKKAKKTKKNKNKLKEAAILNSAETDNSSGSDAFTDQNEAIIDFLRVLAICHSVIAEEDPDTHGMLPLQ